MTTPAPTHCIARLVNGNICTHSAKCFGNYCKMHFNAKINSDVSFRKLYHTHLQIYATTQEIIREDIHNKKLKFIQNAPNAGPEQIQMIVLNAMHIWAHYNILEYDIPKAYIASFYLSPLHPGFPAIIRAVATIYAQMYMNYPAHRMYSDVPMEEKINALQELHTALDAYGDIDLNIITNHDLFYERIQWRLRQDARREQLARDLRERPVVFQRDPEGSINLAAFAVDDQSVHRSSIQTTTQNAISQICTQTVSSDQETLVEITDAFNTKLTCESLEYKNIIITEITNDYYNTIAFNLRYGNVLDHVWAFIITHEHYIQLLERLAQEVYDGCGMCSNGKMARLVNVLQGFHTMLEAPVSREIFQNKFALLAKLPIEERKVAADQLFAQFQIPAEEQSVWLEPLLDI